MWRHIVNLFLLVLPPTKFFWFRRSLLKSAGLRLENNVRICGHGWIYGRGEIIVGSDSWVGLGVMFYSHIDSQIRIGRNCDIGPETIFVTGSHSIGDAQRRAGAGTSSPIKIGDGCWLGARVTVLGGVNIGSGAIIAAGALVTRDVAPHTMVAGVPARVVRSLEVEVS